MTEIWKDIYSCPGYQVSNTGKVKSLNYKRTGIEKILKPGKDKYGYLQVNLSKEGINKTKKVHRLVADAFLDNPFNLPQINHIDECKTNNNVENLEFCDNRYNSNFGTRNERVAKKLSKKVKCLENGVVYASTQEAQRQLGIYHSNILRCCNRKSGFKTAGGLHWDWAD